jgi:hypothetical protein
MTGQTIRRLEQLGPSMGVHDRDVIEIVIVDVAPHCTQKIYRMNSEMQKETCECLLS